MLTKATAAAISLGICALIVVGLAVLPGPLNPAVVDAQGSSSAGRFVGVDGREIAAITISGKPATSLSEAVDTPDPDLQSGTNVLSEVPAFDWSYGCSATSAAMLFGYYDRIGYENIYTGPANGGVCPLDNSIWGDTRYPHITCHECPLSATCLGVDNRTSRGHVDDYWIDYSSVSDDPYISGGWLEHTQGDCTGDFMGTNQSLFGNRDGATTFYYYTSGDPLYDYEPTDPNRRDGCHGMRLFAESRGYGVVANFSQYIKGKGTNPSKGFTFDDFVDEIDAGRPVLIQLEGHTVLGFGYATSGSQVYIRDTWDHSAHQMTWGDSYAGMEHYGVSAIELIQPMTPLVVTNDASNVEDTSARLNGDLDLLGTATSVEVSFQWGVRSGTYTASTAPQSMTAAGPFFFDLTGLSPGTAYFYRARAVGDETGYGVESSFATSSTPPSVLTGSATHTATDSATLNGSLTSLGSAADCSVSFEWGLSPGSYSFETVPQTMAAVGTFSFDLGGLSPGATYYYRAKAVAHGTSCGDEESLTTLTTPPSVVTVRATGITATTTRLNGNLADLGTAPSASVAFEWGTSSGAYSFEKTLVSMMATGPFSLDLNNLMPGMTYYYRARAVGDGTGYGSEESFVTLAIPPSVSTLDVTQIGTGSARLDGYLDSLGSATVVSVSFAWGTSPGAYPNESAVQAMMSPGAFGVELSGLASGTTYYFRAEASGEGVSYGAEKSFTTSTTPPSVATTAASAVGTSQALLRGDLTSRGTALAVYISFQWGISPGHYSGETVPQMVTGAGAFECVLPDLNPGSTYYFRAKAAGEGTSYGLEESFTTLTMPPSISAGTATRLTFDSAVLSADLTSLGTADCVNVYFQFSTCPGLYDGRTIPLLAATPGTVSSDVSGLIPGTVYYFRGVAEGVHGVACGPEGSFATPAVPPSVVVDGPLGMTEEAATIGVNLVSLGSAEAVDICLIWGTSAGGPYLNGTAWLEVATTGPINLEIAGLVPGTTYYYVAAVSAENVTYSAEKSFATLSSPPIDSEESMSGGDSGVPRASSAGTSAIVLGSLAAAAMVGIAALFAVKRRHR